MYVMNGVAVPITGLYWQRGYFYAKVAVEPIWHGSVLAYNATLVEALIDPEWYRPWNAGYFVCPD